MRSLEETGDILPIAHLCLHCNGIASSGTDPGDDARGTGLVVKVLDNNVTARRELSNR